MTAGDEGWEERMAARAAVRRERAEAAERAREEANDPHAGHHGHLIGTAVYCSCGEFEGITCVAFPGATREEWKALGAVSRCEACGQRGVSGFMPQGWEPPPVPPSGVYEAISGMLGDLMWRKAYSRAGELDSPSGR